MCGTSGSTGWRGQTQVRPEAEEGRAGCSQPAPGLVRGRGLWEACTGEAHGGLLPAFRPSRQCLQEAVVCRTCPGPWPSPGAPGAGPLSPQPPWVHTPHGFPLPSDPVLVPGLPAPWSWRDEAVGPWMLLLRAAIAASPGKCLHLWFSGPRRNSASTCRPCHGSLQASLGTALCSLGFLLEGIGQHGGAGSGP